MENPELWLTPLILLPGVGMIIMSTSIRYNRLHDEVHHILNESKTGKNEGVKQLFKRASMFKNALVSLYICISLFSISGLLGGLSVIIPDLYWTVTGLVCLGILFLVYASVELILESLISLDVIKDHYKELESG